MLETPAEADLEYGNMQLNILNESSPIGIHHRTACGDACSVDYWDRLMKAGDLHPAGDK